MSSTDADYARRLQRLSGRRWKRLIPNPYRWNIRRLVRGRVLDVGCGIGRCLDFVRPNGVGVDPNEAAIAMCRDNGHEAFTPEEFATTRQSTVDRKFDTLLCSHVLEHLDEPTGVVLLRSYLSDLVAGGRVILITPQQRGQRSDPTHVRFVDAGALRDMAVQCGLTIDRISSFPLPRVFGRWFVYNETVTVARVNPA
jgi:2-polyprenyl-3-methyl-5-hydroxy-6-metoxy-1,4-benzoquinol methylase